MTCNTNTNNKGKRNRKKKQTKIGYNGSLSISDDTSDVSDFEYLLEADLGKCNYEDFLLSRKKQLFDFGGNLLSFHKKRGEIWRIVTDLSKKEAEKLWDKNPLGQYRGNKLEKAWSDLQCPLYEIPQMTYQFVVDDTIVKSNEFMLDFLKQQQPELFDQIYQITDEKKRQYKNRWKKLEIDIILDYEQSIKEREEKQKELIKPFKIKRYQEKIDDYKEKIKQKMLEYEIEDEEIEQRRREKRRD